MLKYFSIRLPAEMLAKLRKLAKKEERTVGYLIRRFIVQGLKDISDA